MTTCEFVFPIRRLNNCDQSHGLLVPFSITVAPDAQVFVSVSNEHVVQIADHSGTEECWNWFHLWIGLEHINIEFIRLRCIFKLINRCPVYFVVWYQNVRNGHGALVDIVNQKTQQHADYKRSHWSRQSVGEMNKTAVQVSLDHLLECIRRVCVNMFMIE